MLKKTLILTLTVCALVSVSILQPAYAQLNEFKLTAADGKAFDEFGWSISISGDYVVVGAAGVGRGSAYVFKRTGTTWAQEAKLLPSDGAAGDNFGLSLSISGEYVVVGAGGDDDNGDGSGSAYVFKRTGTSWAQEAKLLASDGAAGDAFGNSVSISGDYVVVGAFGHADNALASGSAYVFKRSDTSWVEEAKLLPLDGVTNDLFGLSISISGDYVVVGAIGDDDNGIASGSAYIFKRSNTDWVEEAKLLASDGWAGDSFGRSVSIYGDYAVVGASGDDLDDNTGPGSGSAYVFKRSGASWTQEAKLLASDGAGGDSFGSSVSIYGDYAVVGAFLDDDDGDKSGSAYIFRRSDTSWTEEVKLLASDGAATDRFGRTVSISADYAVVGALGDNDNGSSSGSAYLYNGFILNSPFVVSPIMDVVADEDFGSIIVALLDTVFDDPDLPNDSLRYTVSFSSVVVTATVAGDTLRLFSVADSNGMAEVVVTATDNSSASVSDTFNVTIQPVNDDPSRFTLTFPLGDTLNTVRPSFSWNPAIDPDSRDIMDYQISISTSESMESPIYSENLYDTTHTIPDPLTDDIKYYWTVSAKDSALGPNLDYGIEIEPIFSNNCTSRGCHVSGSEFAGLNLEVGTSFGEITGSNTTTNAPLVIAGNPDISPLIWKLEGVDNNGDPVFGSRMPFLLQPLPQSTINLIRRWITEGAGAVVAESIMKPSLSDTSSFLLDKQESPLKFSLVSPADNSTIDSLRPVFKWMSTVDPDPRDEVRYQLIIRSGAFSYMSMSLEDTTHQVTEDIEIGNYIWWVTALDDDDEDLDKPSNTVFSLSVIVGIEDEFAGIPEEYDLYQNYPNPFNPSTLIKYALPKSSNVSLVIYNLMGQEIMSWEESNVPPGYYEKIWNGTTRSGVLLSSGIYIYRITAGDFVRTRKMVLLK